jgi:hypothetical protein
VRTRHQSRALIPGQDVRGRLIVLADQARRAIYDNGALLGSDSNQLYVGGQASDRHLAAVALTTDWPRDFGFSADIINGGRCISVRLGA